MIQIWLKKTKWQSRLRCQSISIKTFTQIHTTRHCGKTLQVLHPAHLDYCGPLLFGIGSMQARKLEETNYYTLTADLGLYESISYDEILKFAKTNSLYRRRNCQSLVWVYKALNNLGPLYISESFFKLQTVEYTLRGRETKLALPKISFLEWVHKSFSYIAAMMWNSLRAKNRGGPRSRRF